MFLHVLASPGHPQGNSLYISEGTQAFTLLVMFLLYYDKMFTKRNNFLYTRIVNILSWWCITMIRNKRYFCTFLDVWIRIHWRWPGLCKICREKSKYYFVLYFILYYILTDLLALWSRVLLEKLTGSELVNKFPHFMEPKVPLQHSKVPTTSPYPEPIPMDQSGSEAPVYIS